LSATRKIIIGAIVVVVLVVGVVGVLIGSAFVGWKAAVRSGIEAGILQNMKAIAAVEVQYFNSHNRNFGTFDQMVKEQMLDLRFTGERPTVDDHIFTLKLMPKTTSQPASYTLQVDPWPEVAHRRHFYLDSTDNIIHVNADHPAGPTDPVLAE
jgi:hypothetical protein